MKTSDPFISVPKDTKFLFQNNTFLDNPALLFDRYILINKKEDNRGKLEICRKNVFNYLIELFSDKSDFCKYGVAKLYQTHFNMLDHKDIAKKSFNLKTYRRLIVGLGNESVYEVSIKLHRNYGVPIIPGSALKGVARYYSVIEISEKYEDEIMEELENLVVDKKKNKFKGMEKAIYILSNVINADFSKVPDEGRNKIIDLLKSFEVSISGMNLNIYDLKNIFGSVGESGKVIFFDAYPYPDEVCKDGGILEMDIMNPHHTLYYSKNEPPGDWEDPKPILFLTVKSGVKYRFILGAKKENARLVDIAEVILKNALMEYGVGAKTSLGYGLFKEV